MEILPATRGRVAPSSFKGSGKGIKVPQSVLQKAGFIVTENVSVGSIIDSVDHISNNAAGNSVYIDLGSQQGVAKGDRFTVFVQERLIRHPVEKEPFYKDGKLGVLPGPSRVPGRHHANYFGVKGKELGYLARTIGTVEVTETSPDLSKAVVLKSYEPIVKGYFVTPYQEAGDKILPPENVTVKDIDAYIVASLSDYEILGPSDIVYIDKGSSDNVAPGDWFEAYFIPEKKDTTWYKVLPDDPPSWIPKIVRDYLTPDNTSLVPEVISDLQVIATTEHTATLLVRQSQRAFIEPLGMHVRFKR
ncbi:MAG: hypothetical protein V3U37_01595 [Nitrospinaceae bacterium]